MTQPHQDPFASGELLMRHRHEQGLPITCGAPHGCVTAVVADVRCPRCRDALAAVRLAVGDESKASDRDLGGVSNDH
jgi:hypothetical protein